MTLADRCCSCSCENEIPRGFSVRHVLIHVNGVSEALENADFFSEIIDFGQFLID